MLNLNKIRQDFYFLKEKLNDKSIIFLDNASSSQKPQIVIDKISSSYAKGYSNIHRGLYSLSEIASHEYEKVRNIVKTFINAKFIEEIIFTKGATESINLVAYSLLMNYFQEGDEIIITQMEHHANIVPWHIIMQFKKLILKYIPMTKNGDLCIDTLSSLITNKTRIISVTHCSNVLGTINPVKSITHIASHYNIPVLIDGAQSIAHQSINVQDLNCDFFVFSSHKLYGPTGVGILYAKKKWHDIMCPYQGGGGMIENVTMKYTTFSKFPYKFEAGTPNIVGVIGFGSAIEYVNKLGFKNIITHESKLLNYATSELIKIKGLKIIGTSLYKAAIISFSIDNIHPYDVATLLNLYGICIRTGHHCAQPLLQYYGFSSVLRISFGIYNILNDIDVFIVALRKSLKLLKV